MVPLRDGSWQPWKPFLLVARVGANGLVRASRPLLPPFRHTPGILVTALAPPPRVRGGLKSRRAANKANRLLGDP
jgi:hypothetical protein